MTNLLNNAIKFTQAGSITLRVVRGAQSAVAAVYRFEVQDSGIGISTEAQDKIFQAFNQADASTTRRFGGTGLGLSISKKLVELMGGQIGVNSAENVGSTFWFMLPLAFGTQSLADLRKETNAALPSMHGLGARILVAEDNMINQMVAIQQLRKLGIHADAVGTGGEVLVSLKTLPYDLVLMDCHMPDIDGYETTRLIRRNELPFSKIPIVAMTANALKGDREKCLQAGMNDYVAKPVELEALARVLEKWLSAKAASKAEPKSVVAS